MDQRYKVAASFSWLKSFCVSNILKLCELMRVYLGSLFAKQIDETVMKG